MKGIERLVPQLATRMKKTENFVQEQLKSLRIEKVFDCPEIDVLKKGIQEYLEAENLLKEEVEKSGSKLDIQIQELEKKASELKKQKSKIADALTEVLGSGGDSSDLYLQLHQTSQELRDVQDLINIMKRKCEYPGTIKVKELAKNAYDKGLIMIKAHIKARDLFCDIKRNLNLLSCLIEGFERDYQHTLNQNIGLRNCIIKDFCHYNSELASLHWNELEKVVNENINENVGGDR